MAVYGYVRVSTDRQADEGESLGQQERAIKGYAMMHGLTLDRVYVERGASLLKRPSAVGLDALDPVTLSGWIREHTDRVNLLLPDTCGREVLSLLEVFLHVRWRPAFEGKPSEGT